MTSQRPLVVRTLTTNGRPGHAALPDPGPAVKDRLHVSLNTVKSQARALYAKLAVHNRAEAVAAGRRLGLIDG